MKATEQRRAKGLGKPLAVGLAILSLVFFLQITAHGHENGRQDAACRICQVSHVEIGPAATAVTLTVPFVAVGAVAATSPESELESFSSYPSSRAPPASLL